MYEAFCPNCNAKNNLTEQDLGVRLGCGVCGAAFIFGEEIKKDLKRKRDEQRRIEKENLEKAKREAARFELAKRTEAKRQSEIVLAAKARAEVVAVKARQREQGHETTVIDQHSDGDISAPSTKLPKRRNLYPIIALSLLAIIAASVSLPYITGAFAAMESAYSKEAKVLSAEFKKLHANIKTGFSVMSLHEKKQVALDSFHRLSVAATDGDKSRDSFLKSDAAAKAIWELQNATNDAVFEYDESKRILLALVLARVKEETLNKIEAAVSALNSGN